MNLEHLNNIQSVMDSAVENKKIAGLNLMIYKDDKKIGYWQSGYSDVENKKPFARDTICRMYSMTKTVTAAAALSLIEKGKIDIGEEVWRYLPFFKNLTVCDESGKGRNGKARPASRPILVQDLLNMTSGYTYGAWWDGAPLGEHLTSDLVAELNHDADGIFSISTMDVAERLSKIPVSFEPGRGYCYGFSADILGALIQTVSGMKYSEFLKKTIFEPLGMKDTAFYVPQEKQSRLSKVYSSVEKDDFGKRELLPFESPNLGIQHKMNHEPSFESGGAGLCSTVDDYMRFVRMLTNGGELEGHRILQKKTVEFIARARLRSDLQEAFDRGMEHLSGYTYCNLMRVAVEPGKCKALTEEGEFGWDGWLGP